MRPTLVATFAADNPAISAIDAIQLFEIQQHDSPSERPQLPDQVVQPFERSPAI